MRARPTTLAVVCGALIGVCASVNGYGHIVAYTALIGLGAIQLTEDIMRREASMIREALRRADIGIRKAALHMEMDPSDLERALNGTRKLDWWRLAMLPDAFWQELWPLLAEARGVPSSFRTFLKVAPVVTAQKESA